MKIFNYMYAGAVNSYNKNNIRQKSNTASEFSRVLDTVEISSDGISRLTEDKDVRMDKVTFIKEQLSKGKYSLDSARIAENMLYKAAL